MAGYPVSKRSPETHNLKQCEWKSALSDAWDTLFFTIVCFPTEATLCIHFGRLADHEQLVMVLILS